MTDPVEHDVAARRARAERKILDVAWGEMGRQGVAALSVREVARAVGIRQQSLTYYFPTKQALLDALFADGFAALRQCFDRLAAPADPVTGVVDLAVAFVKHLVARPAAYHLMFQGTVPGFDPSPDSHAIALTVLQELIDRLAAAGITARDDVALVRAVMSGIAAEQIANDPGGHLFLDQTERGIRAVLAAIHPQRTTRATARSGQHPDRRRRPTRDSAARGRRRPGGSAA